MFVLASSSEEAVDRTLELVVGRDSVEEQPETAVAMASEESIAMLQNASVLAESSGLHLGLQRDPCLSLRRVDSTTIGIQK